jgi:hypothetical protein
MFLPALPLVSRRADFELYDGFHHDGPSIGIVCRNQSQCCLPLTPIGLRS